MGSKFCMLHVFWTFLQKPVKSMLEVNTIQQTSIQFIKIIMG